MIDLACGVWKISDSRDCESTGFNKAVVTGDDWCLDSVCFTGLDGFMVGKVLDSVAYGEGPLKG